MGNYQFNKTVGEIFDAAIDPLSSNERQAFFTGTKELFKKNNILVPNDVASQEDVISLCNTVPELPRSQREPVQKVLEHVFTEENFSRINEAAVNDYQQTVSETRPEDQAALAQSFEQTMGKIIVASAVGTAVATNFGGIGNAAKAAWSYPAYTSDSMQQFIESFKGNVQKTADQYSKVTSSSLKGVEANIAKFDERAGRTQVRLGANIRNLVQSKVGALNLGITSTYTASAAALQIAGAAFSGASRMQVNTQQLQDGARNLDQLRTKTELLNTKLSQLYTLMQSTQVKEGTTGHVGVGTHQPMRTYKEQNNVRANELMINDIDVFSRASKKIEKKVLGINNLETQVQSFQIHA